VPAAARLVVDEGRMAYVPEGTFVMGTDDRLLAYDNERPAHEVVVPAFRIDVTPVTNRAYLAFMDDGGYRRRELWGEDGWTWLQLAAVAHPAQWVKQADGSSHGSWHERAFGRLEPLFLDQPVVHVCWWEARAYARWAGKRLPTESEWEKAAAWDLERLVPRRHPWGDGPITPERANLDQRCFAPAAAGAFPQGASYYGCHQMLGCVWEWTESDFEPYPGFEAFPYPEYSAIHFGRGYKVLRGGSWATQPIVARNTFRNWDLPQRRQIFAGFRCAADG
jgi:iron(II)-dependent oxidoreductase